MKKYLLLLVLLVPLQSNATTTSDYNPIGFWKLDEETGVRYDSTSNSYDLTDYNSTGFRSGALNNSADFATNQKVGISEDFIANSFTINTWLYGDDTSLLGPIIAFRPNSGTLNIVQNEAFTGNKIRTVLYSSSGSSYKDYRTSVTYPVGEWFMFSITWDGTTLKQYKNCVWDSTPTKSGDGSVTQTATTRNFLIGGETIAGSSYWRGGIDETFVADYVLTADELCVLYNSGTPLPFEEEPDPVTEVYDDTLFLLSIILFITSFLIIGFIFNIIKRRKYGN